MDGMLPDIIRWANVFGGVALVYLIATAPRPHERSQLAGRLALASFAASAAYGSYALLGSSSLARPLLVLGSITMGLYATTQGRRERREDEQ